MKSLSIFFLGLLVISILFTHFFSDAISNIQIQSSLEPPSWSTWFGRDSLGRDLFSRVMQGAKVSLGIGIASSLLAVLIGVLYGGLSAMGKPLFDQFLMRITEVLMSLPSLMLIAVLAMVLQTQISNSPFFVICGALALGSWMQMARLTRNLIHQERSKEYVTAATAVGANRTRIFARHILPNIFSPLLVYWSLQIPHAILAEGLLSFFGFGIRSPAVSWGTLLQEGWRTLSNFPHVLFAPSAVLFLTILSMNILLEDFRRRFDPRTKWEKFT